VNVSQYFFYGRLFGEHLAILRHVRDGKLVQVGRLVLQISPAEYAQQFKVQESPQTDGFSFDDAVSGGMQDGLFFVAHFEQRVQVGDDAVGFLPDTVDGPGIAFITVLLEIVVRIVRGHVILLCQHIKKADSGFPPVKGGIRHHHVASDQGISEAGFILKHFVTLDFRFRLHFQPLVAGRQGKEQEQ